MLRVTLLNNKAMKDIGYFGIGCFNMKTHHNYGSLFRTAQILNADFLFLIGARFNRQASDTMCSWRHLPVFEYDTVEDFQKHRPYDCKLIGIEMTDSATPITEFTHPKRACYLLGAEDNGLSREAIDLCQEIIRLPGERSMNVSVAGSIVIYDRVNKLNY